jgi:hypothetical protein
MKVQKRSFNRCLLVVLALCLSACLNIKQSVSTTERVKVSGIISQELLSDGTRVWKLSPSDESITSIHDALLRETVCIQGAYLVTTDSSITNTYHGEYATFVSTDLCNKAAVSVIGDLMIGYIAGPQNRHVKLAPLICVKRIKLFKRTPFPFKP